MRKIKRPAMFDVDETLIKDTPAGWQREGIEMDYYGMPRVRWPHKRHIELLRAQHIRGKTIVVWSANGWKWAEEVVTKLGLTDIVSFICDKPTEYFDDKDIEEWAPRVYVEDK